MFNVELLPSVEMCDQAAAEQAANKQALLALKTIEQLDLSKEEPLATQIAEELGQKEEVLAGFQVLIDAMPEGRERRLMERRMRDAQNRQSVLEDKEEVHGPLATTYKHLAIAKIDKEVEAIDSYLAAVEAHKANLIATG